jgi:hypothetical protein
MLRAIRRIAGTPIPSIDREQIPYRRIPATFVGFR